MIRKMNIWTSAWKHYFSCALSFQFGASPTWFNFIFSGSHVIILYIAVQSMAVKFQLVWPLCRSWRSVYWVPAWPIPGHRLLFSTNLYEVSPSQGSVLIVAWHNSSESDFTRNSNLFTFQSQMPRARKQHSTMASKSCFVVLKEGLFSRSNL